MTSGDFQCEALELLQRSYHCDAVSVSNPTQAMLRNQGLNLMLVRTSFTYRALALI